MQTWTGLFPLIDWWLGTLGFEKGWKTLAALLTPLHVYIFAITGGQKRRQVGSRSSQTHFSQPVQTFPLVTGNLGGTKTCLLKIGREFIPGTRAQRRGNLLFYHPEQGRQVMA